MLYRKATAPGPCRVIRGGQPWHGLMKGSTLLLPNGGTTSCVAPSSGDTMYIKKPGLPVPTTPPSIAAQGGEWRNYAILATKGRLWSPKSYMPINAGYPYIAPSGAVWWVNVVLQHDGAASNISYDQGTGIGQTMTFILTITAARSGNFVTLVDEPVTVTHPGWTGTASASQEFTDFSRTLGADSWPGHVYDVSPTGDEIAVHIHLCARTVAQTVSSWWPAGWMILKTYRVTLTEPTVGTIAASMVVGRTPTQCFQQVLEDRAALGIAGHGFFVRMRGSCCGTWRADGSYCEIDGETEHEVAGDFTSVTVRMYRGGATVWDLLCQLFRWNGVNYFPVIQIGDWSIDVQGLGDTYIYGPRILTNNLAAAMAAGNHWLDYVADIQSANVDAYMVSPSGSEMQRVYLETIPSGQSYTVPWAHVRQPFGASWNPVTGQIATLDGIYQQQVCWV